jgi:pimeloyl-ACP methyl ester carboxylesterase
MLQPSGLNQEMKIKNATISYNDVGEKKQPVIIFIHGFPFNKSMWNGQLEALGSKYRCIALDLPGYGGSESADEISIENYADLLDEFMRLMQIDKAAICGLSMGGYIALRAIVKYPERFSRLILCDTQCIADTDEGRKKRFSTIEAIEKDGLLPFTEGFMKNLFTEKNLQSNESYIHEIKTMMLSARAESVTATLKALAGRAETCSNLKDINIPVLVICGEEDKITPVQQAKFLSENIRGAKLKLIPDAAHLSNLEQPDVFNEAVREFMAT